MQRRSDSKAGKAQVVQACSLPGNSVACVVLSHGINTHVFIDGKGWRPATRRPKYCPHFSR